MRIRVKIKAPKLYKQFLGEHLTIVSVYGQTLAWKVGTRFYDYHLARIILCFKFCVITPFQSPHLSNVSTGVV